MQPTMPINPVRTDDIVNSKSNITVGELLDRIAEEYKNLSKTLKVIALYIEKHRDRLGLQGIQSLAIECDVQPSAVIRFAKHFGFSGFAEMQRVFRDDLERQITPGGTYAYRMRELIESGSGGLSPIDIAREYLTGSMGGMQELRDGLQASGFESAVNLLANADTIWIAGSRRSFPIAVYLEYALQHTDRRVGLISALGSMHLGQMNSVRQNDVMVAISFAPYADETLKVAEAALQRGVHLIAITDSTMSPLAREAHASLVVQESSTFGFRSLSSTMALAQSLFIALAYRLELSYQAGNERSGSP